MFENYNKPIMKISFLDNEKEIPIWELWHKEKCIDFWYKEDNDIEDKKDIIQKNFGFNKEDIIVI